MESGNRCELNTSPTAIVSKTRNLVSCARGNACDQVRGMFYGHNRLSESDT